MTAHPKQHVLIIGAGSMGLISGYILSQGGADVTFLVRPHRAKILTRPQLLYSYDDNDLKTYTDYNFSTDPVDITGANADDHVKYDYILITLDGHALKNEVGLELVRTLGDVVRGTKTKVIIGTVFLDLRPWFLRTSGIDADKVTNGQLLIHAYEPKIVTLPLHEPTDAKLLAQADQAYTDKLGPGFVVDDSSTAVAEGFAELYNASGISKCNVMPAAELGSFSSPMFAILAVSDLLGWPKYEDIDIEGELWTLAIQSMKEIQSLRVFGETGQTAAQTTTAAGVRDQFVGIAKVMYPLDFVAFNKYHHGAKVNTQDRELLRLCISYGEADGKSMIATQELVKLVEQH
ncbi:hypothetical protein LTR10_023349 [Elasticomyces elasticus]|uniref:Ketopantoate reductase N-terminal domain-containing protein n=1 Tax=Exophiala sideris TaxID=1016849 RepID=A0ABR0IUM2_9EURO|nr:hypothetical protein LTR10_023349 [Elasticomyces elasticus]KAK5021074.1 hypothetical protein LTS07_011268 [Exophiala sideris]KAK5023357.1 hypothetical protein LTR13_011222 [Exophiala sideris]KAK5048777.1 hypothetical protein LTR69_011276 [Exophiala sideris]KAK5176206.1 hypothetical protein LTR44_011256 [Eurotiomycetes sp. CCFEE 6388]